MCYRISISANINFAENFNGYIFMLYGFQLVPSWKELKVFQVFWSYKQ